MKLTALSNVVINDDGSVTATATVMGENPKEVAFLGFCGGVAQVASSADSAVAAMEAEAKALKIPFPGVS